MRVFLVLSVLLLAAGCTPTVRVEVPTEPIVINLNIDIEHKIKIQIDKELDDLIGGDEGLF